MRAVSLSLLTIGLFPVFALASQHRAQPASAFHTQTSQAISKGSFKVFTDESLGVKFKYPAGYKLAAGRSSPPELATYDLKPPDHQRSGYAGGPLYSRYYSVCFLKLDFVAAAKRAGFARRAGKWMIFNNQSGTYLNAKTVAANGWRGLSGTFTTRLHLARGAKLPPNYWHAGRYLGLSEGTKILLNGGGQVSILLRFDPDLKSDELRDMILKSLRFFKPVPQSEPVQSHP